MEHQERCPSCGALLGKDALFCIQCGAAVQVPVSSAPATKSEDSAERNKEVDAYRQKPSAQEPVRVPQEDDTELQTAQPVGLRLGEDEDTDNLSNPFLSPKGGGLRSILHPNVKPFLPSLGRRVRFRESVPAQPEPEELPLEAPAVEEPEAPIEIPVVEEPAPPVEIPAVEEPEAPVEVPVVEEPEAPIELPVIEEPEPPVELPVIEEPEPPVEIQAVKEPEAPIEVTAVEEPEPPVELPVIEEPESPVELPVIEEPESPVEIPVVEEPEAPIEVPVVEEPEAPVEVPVVEEPEAPVELPVIEEPEAPIEVPVVEEPETPIEVPVIEEPKIPAKPQAKTTVVIPEPEDISEWMQGGSLAEPENEASQRSEAEQKQLADQIRQQVEAMYPDPMPEGPADEEIPSPSQTHNRIITAPIMGGFGSPAVKELSKAKPTRFGKANSDTNDNARRK